MTGKKTLGVMIGIVALIGLLSLALVGCGETTTTTASPETTVPASPETTTGAADEDNDATEGKKLVFAESNPIASNQHQMAFEHGKREMCKILGVDFVTADANITPAKQVADIETFIQQEVDGICSWTLDQGAATAIYKKAQDAGIPVVTENSPGDYVTATFVQEQNTSPLAQIDAAEWFSSVYPEGKIFIVGGEPVPYILYVADSMEKAAKAAGLEVLAHQNNMSDQAAGAQQIVQELLTKHPDVQAVWCFNDRSALGASAALRAVGKKIYNEASPEPDAVFVTGMNGTQEALEAVKAGIISATWAGQSEKVGAAEIELLYRIATDEIAKDKVPPVIICPYKRWDGTNIDEAPIPTQATFQIGVLDEFLTYTASQDAENYLNDFFEFLKNL